MTFIEACAWAYVGFCTLLVTCGIAYISYNWLTRAHRQRLTGEQMELAVVIREVEKREFNRLIEKP